MPTINPYRIVLADDHVILRQGLRMILEQKAGLKVIGEVGDGVELLDLLDTLIPHMVILDISMPKLRGIEATRRIKMAHPDVKVLILTMHKSQEYLDHGLSAGADGFLLKEDANTELFSAIDRIRRGETYISPLLSGKLTDGSL
jgi:DNA-binding NarL/FixJ family response regulator